MQSPLIFIAEFQTAKSRLLKNFDLWDHDGFSHEPTTTMRRVVKSGSLSSNPGRANRCMKPEQLLRTEFYRTRSAGLKTESINPNTPRIRRRFISEASQSAQDYSSADIRSQASYRARPCNSSWRRGMIASDATLEIQMFAGPAATVECSHDPVSRK
jgi:hypothetical protein